MTRIDLERALRLGRLQICVRGQWTKVRPNGRRRDYACGQFELPVKVNGAYFSLTPVWLNSPNLRLRK